MGVMAAKGKQAFGRLSGLSGREGLYDPFEKTQHRLLLVTQRTAIVAVLTAKVLVPSRVDFVMLSQKGVNPAVNTAIMPALPGRA
ncbi:hypothetical protein RNAN_2216 [Rheinheimera nanhaiensis E407-8]|uniref:Uncharacterized protein n=1 Tax=Rheinheimera nanhaiensis E407-8 TaxID=562729 RepID=I1DYU6_9GAMM|nr:hypothetical protein RNAN_2216 [Rheinheimera nanhaiensis E407-8]